MERKPECVYFATYACSRSKTWCLKTNVDYTSHKFGGRFDASKIQLGLSWWFRINSIQILKF